MFFFLKNKGVHTQHCWRFEAVLPSPKFPQGCKTTYKAYSSDKVVEFVSKPVSQCHSAIGQYTGLEPMTVYCPWYLNKNGVEGNSYLVYIIVCLIKIFFLKTKLYPRPLLPPMRWWSNILFILFWGVEPSSSGRIVPFAD